MLLGEPHEGFRRVRADGEDGDSGRLEVSDTPIQSDGSTIVVGSATLPVPGFVAIHSNENGSPGPVRVYQLKSHRVIVRRAGR